MPLNAIRRPAITDAGSRTVVLIHGLGADEHDLIGLAPFFGDEANVISVRAPYEYGPGFSWFDIDIDRGDVIPGADCAQALDSLLLISDLLSELPRPIFVAGFSQGAMMAIGILLEYGAVVDGVVAMSGVWLPCFQARSKGNVPILMTHGEFDPIVPIAFGAESADRLDKLGVRVTFNRYPMGHEINSDCIEDVARWVSETGKP